MIGATWKHDSRSAAIGCLIAMLALSRPPIAAASAARIISLTPSVTEILFALGAGPEVVGVSQYCDYPPAAGKLPRVGSFLTPNIEAIVALRPTLVIGSWVSSGLPAFQSLNSMGYPTLIVKDNSLEQIEESIRVIGDRTGRSEQARDLLASINQHLDDVRRRLEGVKPRTVLMVVGHQPLIAVGGGTYLDELLHIAGGINIADGTGDSWPHLSIEYIVAMKPEVILDGQMGDDPTAPQRFWSEYPGIPAVKNHRIYSYPEDLTLHPGPRVWQSLELLASRIHPEGMGRED
jgi:iron complex transport system substrate-binding protein